MQVIDLTREENKLNENENDLCLDMDEDCKEVSCKLTCWLHSPELGICPYLNGDNENDINYN